MAMGGFILHAEQRSSMTRGGLFHQFDDLWRARKMLSVRRETSNDVMLEVAIRISGFTNVYVIDPFTRERFAKGGLREPSPPRQWKSAHVDDARDAPGKQESQEIIQGAPFVSHGV